MKKTGKGPDFITIDGGEGGTGAAPLTYADHVSLPFKIGFKEYILSSNLTNFLNRLFGLEQENSDFQTELSLLLLWVVILSMSHVKPCYLLDVSKLKNAITTIARQGLPRKIGGSREVWTQF